MVSAYERFVEQTHGSMDRDIDKQSSKLDLTRLNDESLESSDKPPGDTQIGDVQIIE